MATGSFMTPIYSRSQSEVQGDLHKLIVGKLEIKLSLLASSPGVWLARRIWNNIGRERSEEQRSTKDVLQDFDSYGSV
ncbi:hypothetical protein TNCV_2455361 [Trichonephila clavipes]|nr:hypothetical protein TNCV_2455361 [Trichonephila clavipes]